SAGNRRNRSGAFQNRFVGWSSEYRRSSPAGSPRSSWISSDTSYSSLTSPAPGHPCVSISLGSKSRGFDPQPLPARPYATSGHAAFHTPGTVTTSPRIPNSLALLQFANNPVLRTYASTQRRAASRAARQSRGGLLSFELPTAGLAPRSDCDPAPGAPLLRS